MSFGQIQHTASTQIMCPYVYSTNNNMQLNVKKTKELRISFLNDSPCFEQLKANNGQVEFVSSFKLLGLIITLNLGWDQHVIYICSKARKRLFAIRLLKRARVSTSDSTNIFAHLYVRSWNMVVKSGIFR